MKFQLSFNRATVARIREEVRAMRYIFVVAVLEALALPTAAHIYYVDPRMGDDGNSGLSPQTSFRALARATTELRAGDVLELAQGAVFRETLRISASGTAAAPIVVRGNGAVLTGNEPVPDESWQECDSDLWVSTNDVFWGACRPRVLDRCGEIISMPVSVAAFNNPNRLKPGETVWNKSGIWFRSHHQKYQTLGLGGVPNEKIVKTMDAAGYDGWYTLENAVPGVDTYTEAVRQVAVLKSWLTATGDNH